MQNKFRGVMQSPVTPLKDDFSLDLATFERVLDFHVRSGAPAISWPHHKGESLNLTIAERKLFAEVAVKVIAGRVPVTIHVSALAVEDTMALARHAQEIGADGILAITPYFWNPSLEAIEAYFVRLCSSIDLPVLSYNSPSYLAGVEITGDLMARLIEKLPNFVGVKEASFNSEKFLEISRAAPTAWVRKNVPRMLTAMSASHSDAVTSIASLRKLVPASLTSTSIPPNAPNTSLVTRATSASLRRSSAAASTLLPQASSAFTVGARFSTLVAVTATS